MVVALSPPEARYKRSYIDAIAEFQQVDGRYLSLELRWLERSFESYLLALRQREKHPAPGRVPESVCWLVEGDQFLGRASLRHRLNANLREIGGHIGYEIRPSQRRKGYGRLLCKLTLEQAWALGMERAMITCDESNIASRKIIEANGGVYEKSVTPLGHGDGVRHYWVTRGA